MSVKLEKISGPLLLGEAPHWDSQQQALFFVSIPQKTIHKYVLATGELTSTTLSGRVGFIIPVEGTSDQFIVGVEREFLIIQWDGKNDSEPKVVKELFEVDQSRPLNRINDGKADPKGRLFAGTMGNKDSSGVIESNAGALYRLDGDKKISKVESPVSISNGLAWDLKENAMYYVDTPERKVRRYDYNAETGEISNMRYVFDVAANGLSGNGDGLTIDTDGNLWLALFGGSSVVKFDPRTGKVLLKLDIPALQVTSVTFGGPNLDILFVTTAHMVVSEELKETCGCTFKVTGLGVKGYTNVNFKI